MKRQDELNEAWGKYANKCSTEIMQALAFALRWCDAHPINYDGKAMLYVNNKSHENGYKEAVDKACDWLKNYAHIYVSETTGDLTEDELINAFRKAMKL